MPQGPRVALLGTAGLLILISSRLVQSQLNGLLDQDENTASFVALGTSSSGEVEAAQCQEVPAHILSKANLTSEEVSLLPSICWHEDALLKRQKLYSGLGKRSGIPSGIQCDRTTW